MFDFDLIDVHDIANKLSIKRAKNGNYSCPNTNKHNNGDKNASLTIYDDGSWKCHGCGEHGRRLELIQLATNYDYKDSEKWLKENFPQYKQGNPTPVKKESRSVFCRSINAVTDIGKGRFYSLKDPILRSPKAEDITKILETMGKKFNIEGFKKAGFYIVDPDFSKNHSYSIAAPNATKMIYEPENPIGILICEGLTDFLSLCCSKLSNEYTIIGRRSKSIDFHFTDNQLPVYAFLDPDDTYDNFFEKCKTKRLEIGLHTIYFVHLNQICNIKDICKFFSNGLTSENLKNELLKLEPFDLTSFFQQKAELPFKFWDGKFDIMPLEFWQTLEKYGFRYVLMQEDKNKTPQLMQIYDNVAIDIENADVQHFAYRTLCNLLPEKINDKISREFIREKIFNSSTLLTSQRFSYLPRKYIEFNRDTREKAFFYFKNGFVEITKDSIVLKDYKELQKPIFKNKIHNRDIELILDENYYDLSYFIFLNNVCKKDHDCEIDIDRYNALKSAIGYMCHKFKDPAINKCVIFTESNTSDVPKGRTGKGLIMQSIKELISVLDVDGKTFNAKERFALQRLDVYHDLISVNDANKGFPLEVIFSKLTDGLEFERKNASQIMLPPNISPKWTLNTNYSVKKENTSSYRARIYEMELYCYYSDDYQPNVELNDWFFSWQEPEKWNLFYSMMFSFVQYYLKNGLQCYESETMQARDTANIGGMELIDYMDNYLNTYKEKTFNYKKLLEDFKQYANEIDEKTYTVRKFGKAIRSWSDMRGHELTAGTARDEHGKNEQIVQIRNVKYLEKKLDLEIENVT